ncbi:MAG TPA: hypothetical protein ENF77_03140 [Candidatus Acetothermia bacterium]|nr:hypothetical protein [Candidatus Acetothermia bacterium]
MREWRSKGCVQLPLFQERKAKKEVKVPGLKKCRRCGRWVIETVLDENGVCDRCRKGNSGCEGIHTPLA